ncbi:MAG TPA: peptide ABC transporter substrate-binding protein [Candidatus Elarobacter sp.]
MSTEQAEAFMQEFVMDPLIAVDDKGRDVPMLAAVVPTLDNGGISRDGLTITYKLRKNVRWQDGAPFTSRDVAFTYHAIMNPATLAGTRHGYDQIARLDTPDPYTAVFRLKRPFAPAVHTFFTHSDAPYFILPAHLLEKYPDLNRVPFNQKPVGTGPFKLVRWLRGDRVEYEANDDYYLGKPKLRKIVIYLTPDENTIVSRMRAHEVDWFTAATPRMFPQLHALPEFDVRLVPMNASDAILFNTKRAPFDDPAIRRAIGLAIDKPLLVRETTYDTTVAATEDLPSFMWAYDPQAGTAKRDLRAANALLDAAGWSRAADGIRFKNAKRFVMGLAYRSDSITDRNLGVVIASMLKDAGIETELKGYTTSLLFGPAGAGILADGEFDAGLQTWFAGSDPDNSTQLQCDQVAPRGFNWSRYCTKEMDDAQRVALTHYDRPSRKHAYSNIERLLARDAPFVYLWWPRQIEAVSTDLRNFRPNGFVESWNSWEWSI